jgi:hypothetical protein
MSLIEGYRKDVRTITVADQTFLKGIWVENPENDGFLRFFGQNWQNNWAQRLPIA